MTEPQDRNAKFYCFTQAQFCNPKFHPKTVNCTKTNLPTKQKEKRKNAYNTFKKNITALFPLLYPILSQIKLILTLFTPFFQ